MAQKRNPTTNFSMDSMKPTGGKRSPYKKEDTSENAPKRPVKQEMTFPMVSKFLITNSRDNSRVEVDHDDVIANLTHLQDANAFTLLTQNVSMSRALMLNDSTAKGNAIVGFVTNFDFEKNEVVLTIYGASVENVTKCQEEGADLHLEPRLVTTNGKFRCFNGFFLISGDAQ